MRNLKRALSLTLASVMLLGMMVVGSSAAAGYDDVKETDNVEAIEVLQAIEVMVGDERGFGPDRPVNRAEMAVVMGKLLSLDYNYYATSCPFNDVYDWARGYVGACYANKIVSGRGDGVYDPGATVTAVEAASMLMRALGYFQYANDVADGFELSTVRQGTKIGIFDGVGSSATEPMTRNQVAQMVLNALQSDTVEPDGNTINLTTPDGTVLTGKVNYVSVTRDEAFATAISRTQATSVGSKNDGWIVELGERLYNGDLKLYEYTDDEFMRPSRTWEYDGKEIGTYMKKENIREEYTVGVTKRELYDLLGRTILQDYKFSYYVDGVLEDPTSAEILKRQTNDYGATGRGVLTQVFVDVEAETIDITSINTYLAKAAVDYSSTTETAILGVYSSYHDLKTTPVAYQTDVVNKTISVADVSEVADVKKDEYKLVNVSGKDSNTHVRDTLEGYDVVAINDVEILSDSTLTKFSKRGSDQDTKSDLNHALFSSVVTGGTEYKSSAYAVYSDEVLDLYANDLMVNKSYNIYLDPYGYAIGIDLYAGEDNYVFITGADLNGSNITSGNSTAAAIFVDGTMKTITVDTKATNKNIDKVDGGISYFEQWNDPMPNSRDLFAINRWFTYTVDSNNVYTLTPATRMITTVMPDSAPALDKVIKCNSVRVDEKAADTAKNGLAKDRDEKVRTYGNDDSVYLVINPEESVSKSGGKYVITDVDGRYTGVQNVEIEVATVAADGQAIANTALYDSIYTVYDKNNYIIASVVIGEARGGDANYAYILTAATSEEELSDGTTVWEFDAIVDGVKKTLKTSSKFQKVINELEPGHIQELRYTGEYVTGVKTPDDPDKYYTYADAISQRIDDEEIYDVGHRFETNSNINNDHDCGMIGGHTNNAVPPVAYLTGEAHLTKAQANDLRVIGRTMYLRAKDAEDGSASADYGLTFVTDAPAVVIHKEDGKLKVRDGFTVATAIAALGDPDKDTTAKEFVGRIVAVLNSQGVAKWVVFISDTGVNTQGIDYVGPGQNTKNVELTAGDVLLVTENTGNGQDPLVRAAALNWLRENGYAVKNIANTSTGIRVNNNFTIDAIAPNGDYKVFSTDLKSAVKIIVDGAEKTYYPGDKITVASGTTTIVSMGTYANATAEAAKVQAGVLTSGVGTSITAETSDITVSFATHNNRHIRTNVITVDGKYYKVNDVVTSATAGTWCKYDTNAYAPVVKDGTNYKVTITKEMDTKTLDFGYYKVSMSGKPDQYIKTGENTTGLSLTAKYARTSDNKFIAVATADIAGASLTDDVTIVDSGWYQVDGAVVDVAAAAINGSTGTYALSYNAAGSSNVYAYNNDYYVKAGSNLSITITVDTPHTAAEHFAAAATGFTASSASTGFGASPTAGDTTTVTLTDFAGTADVSTITWTKS